jgi:ketosteroid isomerase-like protein
MAFDIEVLLDLWTRLPADPAEAGDAFRTLYTDPVVVNGATLTADDLVARAHALQQTYSPLRREVLDVCDAGDKVAVAFRLGGRQVGPLRTAAGVLEPTGRDITVRVIDILTLTDGRISEITMVADELASLAAIGAVRLTTGG